MTILVDTREPLGEGEHLHPWVAHWPADARVVRGTLATGDIALAALPDGAVVERKTVPDFLAAIGRERRRFDLELKRSRYDSFRGYYNESSREIESHYDNVEMLTSVYFPHLKAAFEALPRILDQVNATTRFPGRPWSTHEPAFVSAFEELIAKTELLKEGLCAEAARINHRPVQPHEARPIRPAKVLRDREADQQTVEASPSE